MTVPARRASVTVSPISINMPHPASPPFGAASSPPVYGSAGRSFDLADASSSQGRARALSGILPQVGKALTPFPLDETKKIKILLLENVSQIAVEMLKNEGYLVDEKKGSLAEDELIRTLKEGGYQALGIRSKTKVTARVVAEVPTLLSVCCFCIGAFLLSSEIRSLLTCILNRRHQPR